MHVLVTEDEQRLAENLAKMSSKSGGFVVEMPWTEMMVCISPRRGL